MEEKIEIICDDFLNLKKCEPDLVFLNPDDDENIKQNFSIFKHLSPDINKSVEKALSLS